MIPKKFRNVPWSEFVLKPGDKGQFSCGPKTKVGDVGKIVMNVNLFDNDTKAAIWAEYKVIQIIYPGFCEGVIIRPTTGVADKG